MKVLIKDCDYDEPNAVYIDLRVYSPNVNTSKIIQFTYDTGAMQTIIKYKSIEMLGFIKENTMNVKTFAGFNQAEQELHSIKIPLIRLGDFEIRNFVVYVDFNNKVANLLWYDLLKYFNKREYPSTENNNSQYDIKYSKKDKEVINPEYDDETPEDEQGRLYLSIIPKYRRRFKNMISQEVPNRLTIKYKPLSKATSLEKFTGLFKKNNKLNNVEDSDNQKLSEEPQLPTNQKDNDNNKPLSGGVKALDF